MFFLFLAIFGAKHYLRIGKDDEQILACLEDSDIEGFEDDLDDSEFEATEDLDNGGEIAEDLPFEENNVFEDDAEMQVGQSSASEHLSDNSSDSDPEMNVPLSVLKGRWGRTSWKKTNTFQAPNIDTPETRDTSYDRKDWNVFDYFKMYFEDSDAEEICACTNLKYFAEHNQPMNLTVEEIKKFLGISVLMSCLKFPQIKMYWAALTRVEKITKSMTRTRFFSIRSHLKVVVDNDVPEDKKKEDKLWKVRPLVDKIKNTCLSLERHPIVAIDEQMIPFTGVCKIKQFVRGKPNPEGLKNFVCATPEGLVLDFEIYQGKGTLLQACDVDLGVGPSAVIRLTNSLGPGSHVFMDRYFTTVPLLEYLLTEKKILCTGTIMKSRIPAAVHLTAEKIIKKFPRGFTEQTVRNDGQINVVQWFDQKPIFIISSALGEHPVDSCKRWCKKDSKYLQVPRPHIIKCYNDSMGGIDLIDRMISYYRMSARTKKWTVKTIFHLFDLAIANSWILYRQDRKKLGDKQKDVVKFLEFKLEIADQLLKENPNANVQTSSFTKLKTRSNLAGYESPRSSPTQKTHQRMHLPELMKIKNSMRCKQNNCKKKTKFFCNICQIYLCITSEHNCFYNYHVSGKIN